MALLVSSLVLLTPLGAGVVLMLIAVNKSVKQIDASVLGYGIILGMLLATAVLRGMGVAKLALTSSGFLLASFVILLAVGAFYVTGLTPQTSHAEQESGSKDIPLNASLFPKLVFLLMAALIAAHILVPAVEASYRPLYPWDAAMHWATKSKVWFETQSLKPFVSNSDWLRLPPDGIAYTDHHAKYPPTMPLLQVWICLAIGVWNSSAIAAPWLLFLLALS
ncbi:MAG: hypothetical protein AAF749_14865, partial [Pseudomonadota bacterium]